MQYRLYLPATLCVGLFSFLLAFYCRLSYIPEAHWKNRDDGVITLSSARNVVDFGFVGVGPSGEMVEAFSAPLQAFIYGVSYRATSVEYNTFLSYQGFVSTALLGILAGVFFLVVFGSSMLGTIAVAFTALFLLYAGNFLVWHFSGMENGFSHVSVLTAIVYGTLIATGQYSPRLRFAVLFAALALSRIDLILEVGGILLVACLFAGVHYSGKKAAQFFLAFIVAWGALLGIKWLYIGSLLPHTGYAQGIHPYANLMRVFTHSGREEIYTLLRLMSERQMLALGALVFPLTFFSIPNIRIRRAIALLYVAIAVAILRGILFGGSRLDPVRTVSYLSLVSTLLLFTVVLGLRVRRSVTISLGSILLLPLVAGTVKSQAPFACCDAKEFEAIGCVARKIKETHQIQLPMLANPDLGAVSFHKEFNVYDFGRLANPVLTQLQTEEEIATHFFLFSAPDIVEITPYWKERNTAVMKSALFASRYMPSNEFLESCNVSHHHEFYIRKEIALGANTRERYLMDSFRVKNRVDLLAEELARCSSHNPADCFYVMRVIYRYIPEIRRSGQLEKLSALVTHSSASDLFKRYFNARVSSNRNTNWSREYVIILREFLDWRNAQQLLSR